MSLHDIIARPEADSGEGDHMGVPRARHAPGDVGRVSLQGVDIFEYDTLKTQKLSIELLHISNRN